MPLLAGKRILDIGCGVGMYVRRFRQCSDDVHGVDVEVERVTQGAQSLPNLAAAVGEHLPYRDASLDVVFLHEVLEHVDNELHRREVVIEHQHLVQARRLGLLSDTLQRGGIPTVLRPRRLSAGRVLAPENALCNR